jgi:Winged helix-turn helix
MRFEEAYEGWNTGRLTQAEAAQILGMCERSFRRYLGRYEAEGLDGLIDRRLEQVSHRRAPADEVMALTGQYRSRHSGWNVKHFHAWYKREGGTRSYTWVKNRLQEVELVPRGEKRGAHRKRRERAALPGMMIHQDGSTHEWVAGQKWDLIVTLDDATSEHYSMFFVDEEGTASSFRGVRDVIAARGLFSSFYSDRGSHYWHTPEAGGKVDKHNLTQFGNAMKRLGIEMIPAYSPEARGRSERAFGTHQGRLPQELALAGITSMSEANRYLAEVYLPAFNAEFAQPAMEEGSAFVPWIGGSLDDILCEQFERTVGADNCVRFEGLILQIPADRHRCHYVKAKVRVHRYGSANWPCFTGRAGSPTTTTKGKLSLT